MPKVSVVIPTYNCEKYITETIDNVLNQTYRDFEIIIIDDGSIDNTREMVEKCMVRQQAISYIYQDNAGPGAARNRGIKEAKGKYIAFLDADDVMSKDALLKRVEFLDQHQDVALVFGDYHIKNNAYSYEQPVLKKHNFLKFFKDVINAKPKNGFIFDRQFCYKYLTFIPYPIWTCTVMLRKEITNNIGLFAEDISVGEDREFWLRIGDKYKIGFIDQPLAIYNIHNPNSITKNKERYLLDSLKVNLRLFRYQNINKKCLKNIISKSYFNIGYFYFKKNNTKLSRKYFTLTIKDNPLQMNSYLYMCISFMPITVVSFLKSIKTYINGLFIEPKIVDYEKF